MTLEILYEPTPTELWDRFKPVQQVLVASQSDKPPKGLSFSIDSTHWTGPDAGIHDHRGTIQGIVCRTLYLLQIEATAVDSQPRVTASADGNLRIDTSPSSRTHIFGHFVSPSKVSDGKLLFGKKAREGAVVMGFENNVPTFQAYYLQCLHGYLALEQVVNNQGEIFDAPGLNPDSFGEVEIPGTNIKVPTEKAHQILKKSG